jgi:hypothetical protein
MKQQVLTISGSLILALALGLGGCSAKNDPINLTKS